MKIQIDIREITTRYMSELKEVLKAYYATEEHFCVVVGSNKALENMEEYWNKFLDKEWRK